MARLVRRDPCSEFVLHPPESHAAERVTVLVAVTVWLKSFGGVYDSRTGSNQVYGANASFNPKVNRLPWDGIHCFVNIARCTILSKGGSACQNFKTFPATYRHLSDAIISLHWAPECWTVDERF